MLQVQGQQWPCLFHFSHTSFQSIGRRFNTSPILIPPRAISSSIKQFLELLVRKMISSIMSFSIIGQCVEALLLNVFFKGGELHGLLSSGINFVWIWLKKDLRLEEQSRFVVCLEFLISSVRIPRISSGDMEPISLSPNLI